MSTYKCAKCKKTFKPVQGGLTMRCLVNHSKNDCCHYGEREIVYESPEGGVITTDSYPHVGKTPVEEWVQLKDLHVCSCGDVHVHG